MSDDHLEDEGHGGHSSASFTDLMASLMVIFILLFVATVNNASTNRTTIQNNLLESLRARLHSKELKPEDIHTDARDPYAVVIVMPSSLLFDRDSSRIRENGHTYLLNVIPSLAEILCSSELVQNIDNVVVEGHTDTTYTGAGGALTPDQGQAYNLKLSQARSMEVVKMALQSLRDRSERGCFRGMLSASGRGQEEPLPGVPGNDDRQRRVVFKIRVKADLASAFTARVPTGEEVSPAPSAGVPPP